LRKSPQRAREDQILAILTMVVDSLPNGRIAGGLSDAEYVLMGLDLPTAEGSSDDL
jgi:hypothetical protein